MDKVSNIDMGALLAQLRETAAAATGGNNMPAVNPATDENTDFSALLKSSIETVNENQKASAELGKALTQGDPQVSLEQVMIASQKANISFQAMLSVRNQMVAAYKEIMQMQV
jgi:flagellar hook-basal body complex protein FliE